MRRAAINDRIVTAAPGTPAYDAQVSLKRLLPRLREQWDSAICDAEALDTFESRLEQNWPTLFHLLRGLYGHRFDFFYHLERILSAVARGSATVRPTCETLTFNEPMNPTGFNHNAWWAVRCMSIYSAKTWTASQAYRLLSSARFELPALNAAVRSASGRQRWWLRD